MRSLLKLTNEGGGGGGGGFSKTPILTYYGVLYAPSCDGEANVKNIIG